MAVELLEAVETHCSRVLAIDAFEAAKLESDFRQFDIGGISSAVSPALNMFFEEFADAARKDAVAFCASAPGLAVRAGYPKIFRDR